MDDSATGESGPKLRLLMAAEPLLADKGFSVVSVRDVTQAAKMNVAAVNYHFGSRDGLLARVIERYLLPICQQRLLRFVALEKKGAGKSVTLASLIEAWAMPTAQAERPGELTDSLYFKLIGRIFALENARLNKVTQLEIQQMNDRFIQMLAKLLPTLKADELAARLHFLNGGLIHVLRHQEALVVKGGVASSIETALQRFIEFSVAGMLAGVEIAAAGVTESPQELFDF